MGKIDKIESHSPLLTPAQFQDQSEDRRLRGERVIVNFPLYMSFKGSLIQGFTQALNLSCSGMMIATNFPLNTGDRVQLEFTLPNQHIPITTKAKVVHKLNERVPEEATEMGLAFEELEPNIQRMIAGFVLEFLPID